MTLISVTRKNVVESTLLYHPKGSQLCWKEKTLLYTINMNNIYIENAFQPVANDLEKYEIK